jgi:hypothetical protein
MVNRFGEYLTEIGVCFHYKDQPVNAVQGNDLSLLSHVTFKHTTLTKCRVFSVKPGDTYAYTER